MAKRTYEERKDELSKKQIAYLEKANNLKGGSPTRPTTPMPTPATGCATAPCLRWKAPTQQRCRIWHGSVKRPRGWMPTLPPGLQSFWRRHACPVQNRCGVCHPCRRQTRCCWKLRCTALWLRCGTQRKNMCSCCVPWCGRAAAQYS